MEQLKAIYFSLWIDNREYSFNKQELYLNFILYISAREKVMQPVT